MESRPLSHRRSLPLKEFFYGCAYYPEHWDESLRKSDPKWMREAGFNCVRMGEFSWDLFEPEEGRFDFSLHTQTVEQLGRVGIRTIFCTPTASPPAWLTRRHPEILRADALGVPLQHGSRQHASHMSPVFREHSRRITQALADHFRKNKNVIGWQTDNEFHCHFSEDHSPAAIEAFRKFLRERYRGDIDALNAAWGTRFWSQTYRSFEEILTPRLHRPTWINPAHDLDYRRFLSDAVAQFQREQVGILRAANPDWFLFHNGAFDHIDYRGSFTRDLDFFGYDVYPSFEREVARRASHQAFNLDWIRSLSGNFIVPEQQSGAGGQGDWALDQPEPGEMRRMAWTSIARGADSLLFFRERSCRFGAEEYWCGVLDHDNVPRHRFHEAKQLGAELKTVGEALRGTHVAMAVAVAGWDFTNESAQMSLSLGLPAPKKSAKMAHEFFFERGYATGCIHPSDDLSGVAVYVVPQLPLFDLAWVAKLQAFAERGGILIIGARTATKDLQNNVIAETPPGVLRSLVGATVEGYSHQHASRERPYRYRVGAKEAEAELWWEKLQPEAGTRVLARWTNRHVRGSAAATLRRVGKGVVIYVGTYLTERALAAFLPALKRLPRWPKTLPGWKPGIEIVQRTDGKKSLWFYINSTEKTVTLRGAVKGRDFLREKPQRGMLKLSPHAVAVIQEAA